jgi:FkbH-like protein
MRALLISDFHLQNFAGLLRNATDLESNLAPFGQVTQVLLDMDPTLWSPKPDCCIIWTRPESILPSFQAILDGHRVELAAVLDEVDRFAALVRRAADRTPIVFLPTWTLAPLHLGHGLSDLASPAGSTRCLMAANLHLLAAVEGVAGIYPLPSGKWIELAGPSAFNPRLWYGAKVPFSNDVFKHAVRDLASAIRGIRGRARKLIVVDLDDTLWGGIVGDAGWENLVLGGHDPIGESLVDFQSALKALSRRGVALAIVSKNTESVALTAIREHPEMRLSLDDFAGWRINWNDKAQNIAELVRELNLGLDSVVFLDDNPVERARVRETFPEVLVPEMPTDKRLYAQTLVGLDCFDKPALTPEDLSRVRMYAEERKRTEVRRAAESIDDWLASLNLVMTVEALGSANVARITQLLNKTNQMNLSTRRLTEPELMAWSASAGRKVWGVRVADRFGDSGLTGMIGLEIANGRTVITDFVLSCRVMGRRVEEAMLGLAVDSAQRALAPEVTAHYIPTAKNQPCLELLKRSGFQEISANVYSWDAAKPYRAGSAVRVEYGGEDGADKSASGPTHTFTGSV